MGSSRLCLLSSRSHSACITKKLAVYMTVIWVLISHFHIVVLLLSFPFLIDLRICKRFLVLMYLHYSPWIILYEVIACGFHLLLEGAIVSILFEYLLFLLYPCNSNYQDREKKTWRHKEEKRKSHKRVGEATRWRFVAEITGGRGWSLSQQRWLAPPSPPLPFQRERATMRQLMGFLFSSLNWFATFFHSF